jgi:hypothetical protein
LKKSLLPSRRQKARSSTTVPSSDDLIDWSKTTFEGSRLEQLRRWQLLSVRERLEALDAMTDLAERMKKQRMQGVAHEPTPDLLER